MNSAGFAASKTRFRHIARYRVPIDTEEAYHVSANAMFFRSQTLAIVKHFFEISCQIGRLPSILGREFFRARVSHHAVPSFEDQVIFVHDVERTLARLQQRDAQVIALVGLFQYSLTEAAALLGRSRSTVCDRYADSIDRLAQLFLEMGLLKEGRSDRRLTYFQSRRRELSSQRRSCASLRDRVSSHSLPPKEPPLSVGAAGTASTIQTANSSARAS